MHYLVVLFLVASPCFAQWSIESLNVPTNFVVAKLDPNNNVAIAASGNLSLNYLTKTSGTWEIENVSVDYPWELSLDFSSGEPIILYLDTSPGSPYYPRIAWRDDLGGWQTVLTVQQRCRTKPIVFCDDEVRFFTSSDDGAGNPFVWRADFNRFGWDRENLATSAILFDAERNSAGDICILYGWGGDLYFSCGGGVLASPPLGFPDLIFDNEPYVAGERIGPNGNHFLVLRQFVNDQWVDELIAETETTQISGVQILSRSAILFTDRNYQRLRLARKVGERWEVETVQDTINAAEFCGLFDSEGRIVVAFRDSGFLKVATQCVIPDITGDGFVGLDDLSLLLANFGCSSCDEIDINGDSVVDLVDLSMLLAHFGTTCP